MTSDDFKIILKNRKGAPFLFLGSGFSRHYLGTPQWDGILQMFAPHKLAQYYSKLVGCLRAMMPGWISAFCSEQCLSFFWQ